MAEIEIVLPAVSHDPVSGYLVHLTEQITKVTGEETGYGLGGRFGYGENYENDVFSMHRYCWCDQEDCKWCSPAEGEQAAPNFIHKPTGAAIRWYKYIGRSMEIDEADWPTIFRDCLRSLKP